MADAQKSIADVAAAVGISYQAVRKAVKGESNAFTAENNAKAARFLGVRPNWLATGELPMLDASADGRDVEDQESIRRALQVLRNQLVHGVGNQSENAAAALALLAKVPDSDRAFEDALIAMLAVRALPEGERVRAVTATMNARAANLAKRLDALGPGPEQNRAYAQIAQVLERSEEAKAADPSQPTNAPPAGQNPSPADAR